MAYSRLVPFAVILIAFSLASCANTVRGVGKDVKSTAQAVEDVAK